MKTILEGYSDCYKEIMEVNAELKRVEREKSKAEKKNIWNKAQWVLMEINKT